MDDGLFLMSADWHIKSNNTKQVKKLIAEKIEVAKSRGINILVALGDIFQSRQAQPLIVFKCFEEILDMIKAADMTLYCIAGNHDKTNYASEASFLDQFQWHPAFELMSYDDYKTLPGGWKLCFLPYFSTDLYLEHLQGISEANIHNGKIILITHTAFEGSINNDGSLVSTPIQPSLFENFFKVFSGHYHNQQQIGKNIFHLASLQANNYGEDNDKGFYIFHPSNGDHELIHSTFPEYHTIDINVDTLSGDEIRELTKQSSELIKEHGANIRFKFKGSQEKVQTVKNEDFTVLGIDVKKEHKVIVKSIEKAKSKQVVVYDDETIKQRFDSFCEDEEWEDIEYGKDKLNKQLEKNG